MDSCPGKRGQHVNTERFQEYRRIAKSVLKPWGVRFHQIVQKKRRHALISFKEVREVERNTYTKTHFKIFST